MLTTSSLKFKLIIISFLCLFPITSILGVLIYKQERELIESRLEMTLNQTALALSSEFVRFLDECRKDGALLAAHHQLLDAIQNREFERVIDDLVKAAGLKFARDGVFLLDENFAVATSSERDPAFVKALRTNLNMLPESDIRTGEPQRIFRFDRASYLVLLVPVSPNGHHVAWLAFVINLDRSFDALARELLRVEFPSIVDQLGVVISHAGNTVSQFGDPKNRYSVSRALNWRELNLDVQVGLEGLLLNKLGFTQRVWIYVLLVCLVIFQVLVLAWAVTSLMLRRIKVLHDTARKFADGDTAARVPVVFNDEISELGYMFNSMCSEISQVQLYLTKMVEVRTRQAEETMSRMEAILHSAGDAIIAIDEQQKVISFNLAAESIFGYTEAEMIGKPVSLLMPFEMMSSYEKSAKRNKRKGDFGEPKNPMEITEGERDENVTGKRKSGEYFPVAIKVTRGESFGKQFYIGAIEDLTEKLATERSLDRQRRLLSTAVENSPQPLVFINTEGNIFRVNEAICYWLNYSKGAFLSKNIIDLVSSKYRIFIQGAIEKLCDMQIESFTRELEFVRKDGDLVWGLISGSAITNDDGEVEMCVLQMLDIDESKRLSEDLTQRNQDLEKSNADLDQFAYVASHDLKSPLNAISQIVVWLEEDLGDSVQAEVKENINLLKNRTGRMKQLLNDLLLYSQTGREKHHVERINIKALSASCFDILSHSERFKLIADDEVLILPKVPFELVLRNLLSNAIKHHDVGEGKIYVRVTETRDSYEIKVVDDGPGIPPEMHERAVEMFQTLKSRDKIEGSGMGLALVKKTVEYYGGDLEIRSDGKRGTTIIIHWPKSGQNSKG